MAGWPSGLAISVLMLVAYYAHYFFATITAQVLAMFLPLVFALESFGVPRQLACFALLFAFNLSAGLTEYGTTSGPPIYARGFVSRVTWRRVGFVLSLPTIAVWGGVGLAWWKLLGLW